MSTQTIEDRLTAVETRLEQIDQAKELDKSDESIPWWKRIVGAFADDPEFDEAMRLGREYRESLRPKDGEEV